MFHKTTLKNGLRIITVPQDNTQAVTVLVLVGTGSKYEKRDISGISHFLEHMFFKGTKNRPDKLQIAETLDRVGGIYNAFTSEDCTGYFAKVAASHFELALDWVSDIFLNSSLPEGEVQREKGVVIEEINMRNDNPMAHVGILWSQLLYGDQPAGWDVAGTKESVSAINRQKLFSYMKSQYVAGNTVVCVAGRINQASALKKIEAYFSNIGSARHHLKARVIEKQSKPEYLVHYKETDQTNLCLGVRGYNISHPQKYAQDILCTILGGMMSSRLFMKVREELGLAYYVTTSADSNPDTGYLVTQTGVDAKNAPKAVTAILKEYRDISRIKIPSAELKKAKDYIKGKMTLLLESSDDLASFYATQEIIKKEALTPGEVYDKIDKVSAGDILNVSRDIFKPERLNLAVIGPFKDKDIFQKLLKL